ncbi:alanine racemase [Alsobacter sp. SYSU M60028]|uniref:Alanine racemase n=1 Tax=Alsobacter ponti TaxID=2962936 RepID=A0ABT1LHT2_9HYPH|nr:alanine racemase [Alsobacter ponti]MCP8940250.1 alanine racemase [Alsobacter ponti]
MNRRPPGDAPAGASDHASGAILTIDAEAIATNWRRIGARAPSCECAAVLKADAYGTGLEVAAPALVAAGCRTMFVALPSEGVALRALAPEADIYVLNGLLPGTAATLARHRLRPVLGSLDEIAEWAAFVAAERIAGEAAVHVDTGMNRLGLTARDAVEWTRRDKVFRPGFAISLLMSHLVASETPDNLVNERQIEIFAALRQSFPGVPGSLANSSGVFLGSRAHHDLLRPGYALYGGNPTPWERNPMVPVVRLEARILQVREVGPGETVGYHGRWTARRPSRLATVALGYADGFPGNASSSDMRSGAEAIVAGVRCPVAGRISMDMLVLDVTDAPTAAVRRGALVSILDHEITVDDLAARAGTIGYEVLTQLGRRAHRRVIGR